jgi:outer membrane protein OmpA-like peptidoglycan-associated protein
MPVRQTIVLILIAVLWSQNSAAAAEAGVMSRDAIIRALGDRPKAGMSYRGLTPAFPAAKDRPRKIDLEVNFAFDSAELLPEARRVLDELGAAMNSRQLLHKTFRIVGHTDGVGDAEYNRRLSQRRASAVRRYLVEKFGIEGGRLRADGRGASELLVPADPRSPANRRVEVIRTGN